MKNGNLSIGRADTSPTVAWIGEDSETQVATAPTFGDVAMSAKKATCVLPISNSLIRYADPGIESVVRDQLLKQFASIEDAAFLTGAGSAWSPKGIRWSASTVNTATLSYSVTTASYGGNWVTV